MSLADWVEQFKSKLRNVWQQLFWMHLEDPSDPALTLTTGGNKLQLDLEWAKNRPTALIHNPDMFDRFLEGAEPIADNDSPFLGGVNEMESDHLRGYRHKWPGCCYSLMQNPEGHPSHSAGPTLQTVISACGLMWADASALTNNDSDWQQGALSRQMLASEMLTSQGFRVKPSHRSDFGTEDNYIQCSYQLRLPGRDPQHCKAQAGNSVNVNAMGLLLMHGYAHYGSSGSSSNPVGAPLAQFDDDFLNEVSCGLLSPC